MGTVSAMLVAALIPTANYKWGQGLPEHRTEYSNEYYSEEYYYQHGGHNEAGRPYPAEFAVCYFGIREEADVESIASVGFSIALTVVGFFARVVRLHQNLSVGIVGGARENISKCLRAYLRAIYHHTLRRILTSPKSRSVSKPERLAVLPED